jgi:hypothetical protein
MVKSNTVIVKLERDVVNRLIKRKQVGDTYSTIIKKLLDKEDKLVKKSIEK